MPRRAVPAKSGITKGGLVRVVSYIPKDWYTYASKFSEPGNRQWVSTVVRRAIHEWLVGQGMQP